MKVKSSAPDAYMVFYPYKQEKTSLGVSYSSDAIDTNVIVVKSDILSLNTVKGKGGAGHWNVSLAGSKNYKKLIQPGTWVTIFISDQRFDKQASVASEDSGLKMIGIVKTVRVMENIDPGSGVRTLRYEIAGDDFHTLLNTQIYMNKTLVGTDTPETKPIQDSLTLFQRIWEAALNPQNAVKAILSAIVGGKGTVDDIINKATVTAGGVVAIPQNVSNFLEGNTGTDKFIDVLGNFYQQNLVGNLYVQPDLGASFSAWSMAEAYCHRMLNELYSELVPVLNEDGSTTLRPSVILRAIPFSSPRTAGAVVSAVSPNDQGKSTGGVSVNSDQDPDILTYPTLSVSDFSQPRTNDDITEDVGVQLYVSKAIGEDEIIQLNYGKSDAERFNFFYITGNIVLDSSLEGAKLYELIRGGSISQLGDQVSMARYGLRPYIDVSQYVNLSSFDIQAVNKTVRDMWCRAHLFENGQVIIVGSGQHIPVGTNITFPERGWIAHVEQVSHSYSVSGGVKTYRTVISFVRLQTFAGEPLDLAENTDDQESYLAGRSQSNPRDDDFGS